MTIRKQFTALVVFICAIPFLCALFVFIHQYIKSSDRYLVDGYKQIRKLDTNYFTNNDLEYLEEIMKVLPPDVESALFDENGNVLLSSINDFETNAKLTPPEIWKTINNTSSTYFYQFTSPRLENKKKIFLVTRIYRNKQEHKRFPKIVPTIFITVTILILICVLLISLISRNIFKSIITIQSKTKELSAGDLQAPIVQNSPDVQVTFNEITSILDSLEKMRLALIDVQERKNKFIMGISHDLRTPVAIIKGYTEALTDEIITDPEEIIQSLNLISQKTNQLENMIDTLLNYMKLNTIELRDTLQMGSITKLIHEFSEQSQIMGTVYKRHISCNINLPDNIEIPLNAQLAQRVFENLFQNALRYTQDNDSIEIKSFVQDKQILFIMNDTGIGISEEDLKHIFDLFYRGTTSRREEGMGIGLSVVRDIIDTHNWKIDVKSELNAGTTFTISIPF